jgi:hypothetical protein
MLILCLCPPLWVILCPGFAVILYVTEAIHDNNVSFSL